MNMDEFTEIPMAYPDGKVFKVVFTEDEFRLYVWQDDILYILTPIQNYDKR